MKKPKGCYSDPHYTWLRVAIWQAYDYTDYYNGETISFREMEIDHIVSQEIFKNPSRLKARLKELGLPENFQKDDLLNFVPTRRGPNVEKYKLQGDQVILKALSAARQKKERIIQKIDLFFSHANAVEEAAKIAANITSAEQRNDVIDIILHDMEDFREETHINQDSEFQGLPNLFVKATRNIRLIGYLPEFENPTPSCVIEFRTLLLRGITLCVPGSEVLGSLCRGNDTPIDEKLRIYLQKDYRHDYFHWNLGNCSFKLERRESEELCTIIDEYTEVYINALRDCEKANDFEDCCLVKGGIRLFRIRQSIYHCVYQYVTDNPTCYRDLQLECNLNMFRLDSSNGRLHFMIMLENAQAPIWHKEPEFWVILKSYYGERDGIMEWEELLSPTQVRQWLLEKLLPDAIRYSIEKSAPRKLLRKNRTNRQTHDTVAACVDEISRNMKALDNRIPNKIASEQELLDAVNTLQYYYSLPNTPDYYSRKSPKIYDALLALLERVRLEEYSYRYIAGNIGCLGLSSKEEIITFVKDKINEQREKRIYTAREIELVFRCLGECIERSPGEIGFQTMQMITMLLSDLIAFHNRNIFIEKYLRTAQCDDI